MLRKLFSGQIVFKYSSKSRFSISAPRSLENLGRDHQISRTPKTLRWRQIWGWERKFMTFRFESKILLNGEGRQTPIKIRFIFPLHSKCIINLDDRTPPLLFEQLRPSGRRIRLWANRNTNEFHATSTMPTVSGNRLIINRLLKSSTGHNGER